MSWLSAFSGLLSGGPRRVGPGRLVLVIGPSGAGKDTLIAGARVACGEDAGIVFPRRVVTRPPSSAEDNEPISHAAFERAAADGAFALWWQAHGLSYGIPRAVDRDIEAGRTVVCNVSRTIVGTARERYEHVVAVLVTAPRDIIARRLVERGRAGDGRMVDRIDRIDLPLGNLRPDVVIDNLGDPEIGARKLVNTIYATGVLAV
jgi:ribose 1,5-bisphosphokinase